MRRSHSSQAQSTASHCRLTSPHGRVTVHGYTVSSPLTGCQVTSRPLYRFSRYSKWLYTFQTALLYQLTVGLCMTGPLPGFLEAHNYYTIYYRVSQEERTKLREGVPYVKVYRYNPKHLYQKLNGYGDNGKKILEL